MFCWQRKRQGDSEDIYVAYRATQEERRCACMKKGARFPLKLMFLGVISGGMHAGKKARQSKDIQSLDEAWKLFSVSPGDMSRTSSTAGCTVQEAEFKGEGKRQTRQHLSASQPDVAIACTVRNHMTQRKVEDDGTLSGARTLNVP